MDYNLTVTDPIQRNLPQSQDARSHALSLPEILSPIFEFVPSGVDGPDGWIEFRLTPFALVCRAWFIPAIRKIWRRSSPGAVIILIPSWKEFIYETEFPTTKYQKHTPEEIEELIVRNEWRRNPMRYNWIIWAKSLLSKDYNRFKFYQQYIITMADFRCSVPQMIMNAFINAPSSPFQPGVSPPFQNLSEIEWNTRVDHVQEQNSLAVLLLVSVHAQQIRCLTLDDITDVLPLASFRLPLFLSQLVCLEVVNLPFPPSPLLAVCLEALSRIKHLSCIVARCPPPSRYNDVEEPVTFNPVLYRGSFPALKALHVHWSLENVTYFFHLDNAPSNLQTLTISHGRLSSPQAMTDAFREITKRCESIKFFHCNSYSDLIGGEESFEPASGVVTYTVLESFSRLHRMEEFELTTHFNMGLTDTEIIRLVGRWRMLRLFRLIGTLGRDRVEPKPTLNVLKLLAQCCPNLHKLGLSVSLTDVPQQEQETHIPLFPVLETLAIHPGMSHCKLQTAWGLLSHPVHYGDVHYLVSACPLTCDIDCCFPFWVENYFRTENHDDDGDDDDDARRASLWQDKARFEIIRKQRECFIKKTRILEDTIRRLDSSLKH
ncbi:hypothetical protein QCA50_017923 [Cerrena zonata]|uniref:F-box domain-containing protein n=1 Tax=Cerrena zonata TaxID=2478898 RepID=A0AAW0FIW6_9APHY